MPKEITIGAVDMGAVIEAQAATGHEPVFIRHVVQKVSVGSGNTAVNACSNRTVTISDTTPDGYTFVGFLNASMKAVTQANRLRPYYQAEVSTKKVAFYNDQNSNSSTYDAKATGRESGAYYVVVEATLVYLRSDLAA